MQSSSVGLIFAYVLHFWDVGPALAPYWAHVGPSCGILGSVLVFVMDLGVSVSLNFRPCKALGCVANVFDATGIFPHLLGEGC